MTLRECRPEDCAEVVRLFYDTVHTVNAKDYTEEQLNAWAPEELNLETWGRSLREHYSLVAVEKGRIVGFGDVDPAGYLDRLYVHRDYQRRGAASLLCGALEEAARGKKLVTHASITARPFFEKRGWRVVREQTVKRRGVKLVNFVMVKDG